MENDGDKEPQHPAGASLTLLGGDGVMMVSFFGRLGTPSRFRALLRTGKRFFSVADRLSIFKFNLLRHMPRHNKEDCGSIEFCPVELRLLPK